MMEVECQCGELVQLSDQEVLNFAITDCPRCDSEICLEDAYDDLTASRELAASFYANNAVA